MIDCLLSFLKGLSDNTASAIMILTVVSTEPVWQDLAIDLFPDTPALVERLLWLIPEAQSLMSNPQADSLVCNCFASLLEASLVSKDVWTHFKDTPHFGALLQNLLLEDPREDIRKGTADSLRGIFCTLPS